MPLLSVSEISKGNENIRFVDQVSFSQQRFHKLAIAGETGSGKSTLLKIIAGLIQPDSGEVLFEHERVKGPDEKLVPGHPGISYLSQHFELPKFLRVEQVLAYANMLMVSEAEAVYEVCRIDQLMERKTDELSGGEKQRIALARLLISSPRLLMLDEPFSNLDSLHKNVLKSVIQDLSERLRISCILVSHDPADTLSWADELMVMRNGRILQQGSPEEIYRRPINEYVAGLFGKYDTLDAQQAAAFGISWPSHGPGKKLMIRPEQIAITQPPSGIAGKAGYIKFFGFYSEVEILVAQTSLHVLTANNSFKENDIVYLTIDDEDLWFL